MEEKKVPALRFRGFDNAWEQRKLGDSLSFLKDGTHGTHADSIDGPLLLSAKNIKNGSVNWDETDRRISQDEYDKIHSNFNLENGDILLTIVGSIGETAILKDSSGLTFQRSVAFLRPKEEVTSEFLYTEIQIPAFQKELESRKSTSAQPGIYLGDLSEIPVVISKSKDEQRKIGSYFANLDNLIILHQRKLEMLKKVKKSMLEKMFPKNDAKVPEVRFSDFTDAWEQRRLGELADKVTEKNTLLAKTEVLTNSAEFGIINQREFFDHDIVNENNIGGYYIVRERDFVYNPRISVSAPVGPINCNKLGKSGVMSPLYTVFRVHDIDSVYLEYFFKTSRWHSFMRFNGDSGVRSDRFSIKTELFYKMPIPITKYCEQVKIGKYFSQLDHLISLHQRKLEKLKNIKKSMLEKMFII